MSAFSTDSRFYRTLGLATDLVLLNVVAVVLGLPFVTVGAALLACLVVCLQMVQGAGARPLREFFDAFKRGFVPATVAWLATAVLLALLWWEWLVAGQLVSQTAALVIRAVLLLVAMLLALVSVWFWPLLALRLLNTGRVGLGELLPLARTALLAAVKYLPRSLLAVVVVVGPPVLGLVSIEIGARLLLWFVLIGWALAAYLVVLILRRPLGLELRGEDD